jgi:hypothetical protein
MKNYCIISTLLAFTLIGCRSSILDDPTTSIQFSVEKPSHVKLEIVNSYNTVVAVLVDEDRPQGRFTVSCDTGTWLEGIYFYTLEYRGINSDYYFKSTRKMLLIK